MAEWREDDSFTSAYMHLRNGLYLEVREHSFKSNEWQATIWLKQPDKRIEVMSWEYPAYSLFWAKSHAIKHFRHWTEALSNLTSEKGQAMKPSDLYPLFDDSELTEEEIKRARRIVAKVELRKAARDYHLNMRNIDYTVPSDSGYRKRQDELATRILELVLELFPEKE